jgi:hypothetical protein
MGEERDIEDILNGRAPSIEDVLLCPDLASECRNRLPSLIKFITDQAKLREIIKKLSTGNQADPKLKELHKAFGLLLQGSNTDIHRVFVRNRKMSLEVLEASKIHQAGCTLLKIFPRAYRSWPDEFECLFGTSSELITKLFSMLNQSIVHQCIVELIDEKQPNFRTFAWYLFEYVSGSFGIAQKPKEFFLFADWDFGAIRSTPAHMRNALELLRAWFESIAVPGLDPDAADQGRPEPVYRDFYELVVSWLGTLAPDALTVSHVRLATALLLPPNVKFASICATAALKKGELGEKALLFISKHAGLFIGGRGALPPAKQFLGELFKLPLNVHVVEFAVAACTGNVDGVNAAFLADQIKTAWKRVSRRSDKACLLALACQAKVGAARGFQAAMASWDAAQMEPPKPDPDGYGLLSVRGNLPKVQIEFDALDPTK